MASRWSRPTCGNSVASPDSWSSPGARPKLALHLQLHPLGGGADIDPAPVLPHARTADGHPLIELLVGALGMVVKEHQPLDVRIERQLHHVAVMRVSPSTVAVVLLRRVRRIVHENAGAAGELHEGIAPA